MAEAAPHTRTIAIITDRKSGYATTARMVERNAVLFHEINEPPGLKERIDRAERLGRLQQQLAQAHGTV